MARLICLGHNDCVHYGISFFRDAMMASTELENERTISMAYAVRVRNAKDDVFLSFIDALKIKDNESQKDISTDIENLKSAI